MEYAMELRDLRKEYKQFTLDNINLSLPMGSIMGFIGENGAGKSTTLRSIMGLIETPSGDILLDGKSMMKSPSYDRARAGIGYVPGPGNISAAYGSGEPASWIGGSCRKAAGDPRGDF